MLDIRKRLSAFLASHLEGSQCPTPHFIDEKEMDTQEGECLVKAPKPVSGTTRGVPTKLPGARQPAH